MPATRRTTSNLAGNIAAAATWHYSLGLAQGRHIAAHHPSPTFPSPVLPWSVGPRCATDGLDDGNRWSRSVESFGKALRGSGSRSSVVAGVSCLFLLRLLIGAGVAWWGRPIYRPQTLGPDPPSGLMIFEASRNRSHPKKPQFRMFRRLYFPVRKRRLTVPAAECLGLLPATTCPVCVKSQIEVYPIIPIHPAA